MSSSTPNLKFLLDENVRTELSKLLTQTGFDVKTVPKAFTDNQVAVISKTENRILITNDRDFTEYSEDEIFSVVFLQIPQNDPKSLQISFKKLLRKVKDFKGKLIILKIGKWEEFPLGQEIEAF